ncbi:MAG: HAMP domain-containing protein, partial [Bacteroidales bacterium]
MKEVRHSIFAVILTLVLILLSIGSDALYFSNFEYRYRTKRFNRILREKERIMTECLDGMKPILARGESHGSPSENNLFAKAENNRITILEYIGNKLWYWSDTDFDVPQNYSDTVFAKPLIFMQNGWFLEKSVQAGDERIIGLLRIRSDFGFENDIIKNGFVKDFDIPRDVGFSRDFNASRYHVYDSGDFLFSLTFPATKTKTNFIYGPLLLWTLSFFMLLYLILDLVSYLSGKNRIPAAITACFVALAAIYMIILVAQRPLVLFQTELFSPYKYRMNALIPSVGHLLVLGILMAVLSYVVYCRIPLKKENRTLRKYSYLTATALLVPAAGLFLLCDLLFCDLILNSSINFETFKVLEMDQFTLAGFVSIGLFFSIPLLYSVKISRIMAGVRTGTFILSVITSMLIFPVLLHNKPGMLIPLCPFYFLTTTGTWFMGRRNTTPFNKTVIISLLFGFYSLYLTTVVSEKKDEEKVKIQLLTYSTENDPNAEHLLLDMWPRISSDSTLRRMMDVKMFENNDVDNITDYLHSRYFNGYWANYTMNIVLCSRTDSLRLTDRGDILEDCFSFFDRKILSSGHRLTGTEFYLIDNQQGRSNYLGRVYFRYSDNRANGLFINLYNDINVFQPGYSELLLDKKYYGYLKIKDYSFAKFINGKLVMSAGDFPYDKTDAGYIDKAVDYRFFTADKYRHALYRNGNVTVMISRPVISFQDLLISFAYLFTFIFVFSNLILFLSGRKVIRFPFSLNFRQKLQLSFIGILLFSFTLIGIVVASLAIKQYQSKHIANAKEKLNSVDTELESRISNEKYIGPDWRNASYGSMDELLVKLSNVFNTDINLYDLRGYLIATSRPEIYFRNLTSNRMNNVALINLADLSRSEYIQKEKIGNLEYISAYLPFYNANNDLIAYLNLPYFRLQSVLAKEISNLIVAVVNFTLLLIVISMSLSVFISGRLTSPLAILSSRLASVELGKKSEHLSYKGNDEVGELVKQYNRMVDELDESAQKLANSEREYAWREMAKQIAHEIKNPLTPMKLNVQQLLKSWMDGVPGFEKKLEKFTRNQIEFIDDLSSIASAFSSFAKIPEANPVTVDLMEQIKT